MAWFKHQFFKDGPDNQKRADITIDLKRLDIKLMDQWTDKQKEDAKEFMLHAEKVFAAFSSVIKNL